MTFSADIVSELASIAAEIPEAAVSVTFNGRTAAGVMVTQRVVGELMDSGLHDEVTEAVCVPTDDIGAVARGDAGTVGGVTVVCESATVWAQTLTRIDYKVRQLAE